jgi:hypothetical protein
VLLAEELSFLCASVLQRECRLASGACAKKIYINKSENHLRLDGFHIHCKKQLTLEAKLMVDGHAGVNDLHGVNNLATNGTFWVSRHLKKEKKKKKEEKNE